MWSPSIRTRYFLAAGFGVADFFALVAIQKRRKVIADPIACNENNVTGFLNMLVAARDAEVKRFVYAASSSTYGDHPGLPKVEDVIGRPLSPYAVTKFVNEFWKNKSTS